MKQAVTIVLTLISFSISGQKIKRVVIEYPKSKDVKEVYDVLRSDESIKHGIYYSFYKGQLTTKQLHAENIERNESLGFKAKGQYENDLKDGLWIYYQPPITRSNSAISNVKSEEGNYLKDKKTGIWNTYIRLLNVLTLITIKNWNQLSA